MLGLTVGAGYKTDPQSVWPSLHYSELIRELRLILDWLETPPSCQHFLLPTDPVSVSHQARGQQWTVSGHLGFMVGSDSPRSGWWIAVVGEDEPGAGVVAASLWTARTWTWLAGLAGRWPGAPGSPGPPGQPSPGWWAGPSVAGSGCRPRGPCEWCGWSSRGRWSSWSDGPDSLKELSWGWNTSSSGRRQNIHVWSALYWAV